MRQLLSILFLTVFILNTNAQKDYSTIDSMSMETPSTLNSYQDIAKHLTKELVTPTDKARAIFIWVANNLSYDFTIDAPNFEYEYENQLIDEAIKNRKGVCQHYADLYNAMANHIGLESYVVSGYTKDYLEKVSRVSHAWNLIKIDTSYLFMDVTWTSGRLIDDEYVKAIRDSFFLIPPDIFIKDHMPFDPIWQCLDYPLSHQDFISNRSTASDSSVKYNYSDSIISRSISSNLKQLESSNQRITKCGIKNNLIRKKVEDNTVLITNEKYNNAVEQFNNAIYIYNTYINAKNQRFLNPKLEDQKIRTMITSVDLGIYQAQGTFQTLLTNDKQLRNSINEALELLNQIIPELEREKKFISKYLNTKKIARPFLF